MERASSAWGTGPVARNEVSAPKWRGSIRSGTSAGMKSRCIRKCTRTIRKPMLSSSFAGASAERSGSHDRQQ